MTIASEIAPAPADGSVDNQLLTDLQQARNLVANGWTQQVYQEGGQYCIIGAVLRATGVTEDEYVANLNEIPPRVAEAAVELAETLGVEGELLQQIGSIYDFNDNVVTVQEDVIGLFDTTIKRLAE